MKEQNRLVPYPELRLEQSADLKHYSFDIAEGKLPMYGNLPDGFSAGAIETYANWLAELTRLDPEHLERGAYIFVDRKKGRLIFPKNPAIGLSKVTAIRSQNTDIFYPALNVHTHPRNDCFSVSIDGGDVSLLIAGWKERDGLLEDALLLASMGDNFFLLRTMDTPRDDTESVYRRATTNTMVSLAAETFQNAMSSKAEELSLTFSEFDHRLREAEAKPLLVDFLSYVIRLIGVFHLSEEYKLGFYFSRKDGQYVRFTKEGLVGFLLYSLEQYVSGGPIPLTKV